ncbi:hypothetical protein P5X59_13270 [Staphylococcus cohnii]|uniref:Uncharacterized protein n=1 Tax=Staphylococcus cohnii TaxID=29382 RepID=A0ABT6J431_9STAP|nr:hypothetical protein [Staphylococcus cohnii]MDH5141152.1 hypothetical protein [Staphylococcus cohnii]MDH5159237.1 hypothetical protein [Staphylococcus cohnii]MDH5170722.1 hypothetical protein [Staphylococcus cohnii]
MSEIVHTEDSFLLKLYYKFNFATEPNFVYSAFDIDKIEAIHYKKSLIELIYKQKTITVKREQIIFVDYEYQEKLESQYKMSSDVDRAELFDLIIESTYFYITENHYFTLVINSKNHNRI